MDDLKIVLYIVVAIVWMIYNNYKKIGSDAKKRNPAQPTPETDEFEWPDESPSEPYQSTKGQPVDTYKPTIQKEKVPTREKLKREPLSKTGLNTKKRAEPLFLSTNEGGTIQPSSVVNYEDNQNVELSNENWAYKIRNADYKKAIILTEILQRPYI